MGFEHELAIVLSSLTQISRKVAVSQPHVTTEAFLDNDHLGDLNQEEEGMVKVR